MNQLVGLSASTFEKAVVLDTAWRWVDASEVQVFVPLEFIKRFEDELTVLGADPGEPLEEVLVKVSVSKEPGEVSRVSWSVLRPCLLVSLDHL